MLICGFDVETTGLDVETDTIIEVGAVLWDTERKMPLRIYSSLLSASACLDLAKLDSLPELGHNITREDIYNYGETAEQVLNDCLSLFGNAQAIVAHNAPFDKSFYLKACERHNCTPADNIWLDSYLDVPYDKRIKSHNLITLAAEHGFVNPFPHRALTDVLSMLRIISNYDIHDIIALSKEPLMTIQAVVSFDDKDKAKGLKYLWEPQQKKWLKKVKLRYLEEEKSKLEKLNLEYLIRQE